MKEFVVGETKVIHLVLGISGVVSAICFDGRLTSIICDSDGVERHYLSHVLKEKEQLEDTGDTGTSL